MDLAWSKGVKLIKEEPCGLLVVEKENGYRSHPNKEGVDKRSLLVAPYDFDRQAYMVGDGKFIYLLNRLDAPTSGLMLLASNLDLAEKIRELFRKRLVKKTYSCLVKGKLDVKKNICWKDFLDIRNLSGRLRVKSNSSVGVKAETRVELERFLTLNGQELTELKLFPITGRTHQLRVQSALRGHPILGDKTYGDFALNRELGIKKLCLHASEIAFELNWENEVQQFYFKSVPTYGRFIR